LRVREESELVRVLTTQGWDLAQIYKSKLDAAEIPVFLKHEALGLIYGITVDGLGAVHIMVPAEYAAEAAALLEELEEPEADERDVDEAPGEDEEAEPEDP
jgi:hypothetical protein